MIIRELQINGFGMYADEHFSIDRPMTLFYGKNEAGKSTLFQFIRAILFGFPTRSQNAANYEPQRGGRYGGALHIELDGIMYRMERYGDRRREPIVTTIGNEDGHALQLLRHLENFTADTYRQLFAFGLEELQEIRTLQSEDVGRYLFHAGLGTSAAHLMEVEKQLIQEMDQLYRPRGRNQPMYRLAKQAEEMRLNIQKSMEELDRYGDLMGQIQQLQEEINREEHELASFISAKQELETLRKIVEPIERLRLIEQRLSHIPHIDSFPAQAIERWERMSEEIDHLHLSIEDVAQQLNTWKEQDAQMIVDEDLIAQRETVDRLWEASATFTEQLQRRKEVAAEIAQIEQALHANLRKIGDRFSVEDLLAFPTSIAERKQLEHFLNRYNEQKNRCQSVRIEHEKRLEQAMEEEQQWKTLLSELKERREREQHTLKRFTALTYDTFPQAAEELLHTLDRWDEVNRQIEALSERLHDLLLLHPDDVHRSLFQQVGQVSLMAVPFIIAPILYVFEYEQAAWTLLALGVGWLMSRFISRTSRGKRSRHSPYHSSRKEIEEKLDLLHAERKQVEQQLDNLSSTLWKDESEVAVSFKNTDPHHDDQPLWDVQSYRRFIEEQWQRHRKWREEQDDLERHVNRQRLRYEMAQSKVEDIERVWREQEQQLAELEQSWRSWIDTYRLSAECTPDLLPIVFQVIEESRQLYEEKSRKKQQLSALEERIQTFKEEAISFVDTTDAMHIVPALKMLRNDMEHHIDLARKKETLQEKIQTLEAQKKRLEHEISRLDEQRQALLRAAGAEDEEELRQNHEQYELRRSLIEEKIQIEAMLAGWLTEEEQKRAVQRLQTTSPHLIEQWLHEHEENIKAINERLNEKKKELGKALLRKEQLQSGSEHALLVQTYEETKASLVQTAEKWAVRAFIIELFRRAKQKYEQERQPEVMKLASHYFSILTDGAYRHVIAPFGEKRLIVERDRGEQVDMAQLSRGTAEQLYLAMRLALAKEYSRQFGAFPIIMDDVLVNFDEQRMKAALQLFQTRSKEQQIVMFTCHEHIRSAFADTVQDGAIVHMDNAQR